MEATVELIIYFGAGLMLVLLVAGLVYQWDITAAASGLRGDQEERSLLTLPKEEFAIAAYRFWQRCNETNIDEPLRLYVINSTAVTSGNLSAADLFEVYRQLQWCGTIQSASHGCGYREDINLTNLSLPRVVQASCLNASITIT